MAPLIAGFLYAIFYSVRLGVISILFFLATWVFAFGSTIILGGPIYLLLRRSVRPHLPIVAFVGGLIGVPPAAWILINSFEGPLGTAPNAVKFLGEFFLFGIVGGIIFWLCTVWRDPRFSKQVNA
jgi:hypothetical protein